MMATHGDTPSGKDYLFLRMPRTASSWTQGVLVKHCNGRVILVGHDALAPDLSVIGNPLVPEVKYWRDRYVFSFIREPISWYRSWWSRRIKYWPLTQLWDSDFNTFIANVLKRTAPNSLLKLYHQYGQHADFVGRYTHLHDDLKSVLDVLGFDVAKAQLEECPASNTSPTKPVYDEALRVALVEKEKDSILFYNTLCQKRGCEGCAPTS